MTVIINGTSGITDVNGSAAAPAITGTDTDTGVFFGTNTVSLSTGGTERLQVDSSGNAGLGVTPSAWGSGYKALQVNGASLMASSSYAQLGVNNYWNGTNDIYIASLAASYYVQSAGAHKWFNAPSGTAGNTISFTQAMTLNVSGNLGVGTTSPSSRLDVVTSENSAWATQITNNGSTNAHGLLVYTGASSTGIPFAVYGATTERMRIDSSGRLLVGQTSGTEIFCVTSPNSGNYAANITNSSSVNPNGLVINTPNKAGNSGLYGLTVANSGGNAFAIYTNGTYGTISDINRKKNVETARDGYLTDLCALRVVKYNWNEQEDGEPKELGFIAQEIEQVFAGLVQADDNGQKLVKQPVLIPMLVKAIQEQQAIITQLQADVAALKGQA